MLAFQGQVGVLPTNVHSLRLRFSRFPPGHAGRVAAVRCGRGIHQLPDHRCIERIRGAVEADDDDIAKDQEEFDPTKPVRRQDIFVGLSFLSLAFFITAAAFYNQDAEEIALKPFAGPEVTISALTAVSEKVK